MDIIDTVVGSLRAGHAYGRRVGQRGEWGLRFPAFAGTGFHVVLAGDAWVMAPGMEPVAIHPGDVVLVPHGAEHALTQAPEYPGSLWDMARAGDMNESPADFEFFCGAYRLSQAPLHPFLEQMPAIAVIHPGGDGQAELRGLANFLDHDITRPLPGEQVTRAALVDLMVVHVLREVSLKQQADAWPAVADPSIGSALRALHRAPQKAWTTEKLSAVCNMSRAAFSRRFAAVVGEPPMTYLTRLRLANGARLLRETGEPLDAIARKVGYSSGFAFAHAFRREYDTAPGRFRLEP